MMSKLRHILRRQKTLRQSINTRGDDRWEETCVPSYCHSNFAAAYVSWMRLFAAEELARESVSRVRRVLDFGASVGELSHILGPGVQYDFAEQDEAAASFLMKQNPSAQRRTLLDAPSRAYDVVFAIDSLEHNPNYAELLGALVGLIAPQGILILSGPTENRFYKIGRWVAGFKGDYHFTTIYDIEEAAAAHVEKVRTRTVPMGVPLFRISAWRRAVSAVPTQN